MHKTSRREVYYEGSWQYLPEFSKLKAVKTGVINQPGLEAIAPRAEHFALVLEGYVNISESGVQTFFLNTDDGSKLYINDELVVDHDGDHSAIRKTGQTILAAGKHKIRIEYFQGGGGKLLQAGLIDPEMGAVPFTPFQLSHEEPVRE